ncbi:alkene reductase [Streptomyces sp. NPDC093228]|uniref:alkene reductase n=1 Tax=Streptomyces sp. NPDC093228 TaxID=3155070 RepID=UPI003426A74C
MSELFSPVKIGRYALDHRVVLAPMTRLRSLQPSDSPSPMMVTFYEQRASEGGLQIVEGTAVSDTARAYLGAPGIYSADNVAGWRKVTDAVHAKGGRIFVQLFHPGRQAHAELNGGQAPIAPSVDPEAQLVALTKDGFVPATAHRELGIEEIPGVIAQYRRAAELAVEAGFDGVELHGANGYLPDQFLQDGVNKRTDAYGGSLENRARFLFEALQALIDVWGADRVGLRLSPSGEWGSIADSDPSSTFGYVAKRADELGLAFLHVIEPRIKGDDDLVKGADPVASADLRRSFKGTIIAAGGFDQEGAERIIREGNADLVAFGRFFASNPDLPRRFKEGLALTHYDRSAFWGGDVTGYIDYPTWDEQQTTRKAG